MENRFFACIVPKVFNIWVFVRPLRSLDKTKCLVVAIAVGNRCLIYLLFSCHNSILPIAIVFGCFFGCAYKVLCIIVVGDAVFIEITNSRISKYA